MDNSTSVFAASCVTVGGLVATTSEAEAILAVAFVSVAMAAVVLESACGKVERLFIDLLTVVSVCLFAVVILVLGLVLGDRAVRLRVVTMSSWKDYKFSSFPESRRESTPRVTHRIIVIFTPLG